MLVARFSFIPFYDVLAIFTYSYSYDVTGAAAVVRGVLFSLF